MQPKESQALTKDPALEQKLEQGLAYNKERKYGSALACLKEVVKDLRALDSGKQQILAKALQITASGCLKKGKYRKAIKSAKLALRVLHCLARTQPEAEKDLAPTQQKLLSALEAYLSYTLDQHRRLVVHELNLGQMPKGNLLQLCRDGLKLLTNPLIAPDNEAKLKTSRLNLSLQETLKQLLEWLRKEAILAYENQQDGDALSYCKIATGPVGEALLPSLGASAPEKALLTQLEAMQQGVAARLNAKAALDLETGVAASLKTPPELEAARKHLKSAAQSYHYLDQPEKAREAQQPLKAILSMKLSHASFLSENLTGGRKRTRNLSFEGEEKAGVEPKKQQLK
jgi:hypothetical protein